MNYEMGLRMARLMKGRDLEIRDAILRCAQARHGVVALQFSNGCRELEIEILDEPYEPNVRIFPGED
jgi:hypothetical protein